MDKYYLYVKAFVFLTSLIAIAMVRANVVLPNRVRRLFTLAFADIIAGSTFELLTVWFDGAGAFARPIMCIAQALDYACALFAPIAVSAAFINESADSVYRRRSPCSCPTGLVLLRARLRRRRQRRFFQGTPVPPVHCHIRRCCNLCHAGDDALSHPA